MVYIFYSFIKPQITGIVKSLITHIKALGEHTLTADQQVLLHELTSACIHSPLSCIWESVQCSSHSVPAPGKALDSHPLPIPNPTYHHLHPCPLGVMILTGNFLSSFIITREQILQAAGYSTK